MSVDLSALRAALVATAAGAGAVGVVHDRERYAAEMPALKAFYLHNFGSESEPDERLAGWYLAHKATRFPDRFVRDDDWHLRGFWAWNEAGNSSHAFDAAVEAIVQAFRTPWRPAAGAVYRAGAQGVELVESGPVLFAGVLCHTALLRVTTRSEDS